MPRRKKGKVKIMGRVAVPEIPREAILEAAKLHAMVSVKILRTSGAGLLATVRGSPFVMTTLELVDLDAWLGKHIGGGRYRVEARVANNPSEIVESIPLFLVNVEGDPLVSVLPQNSPRIPNGQTFVDRPFDPAVGARVPTELETRMRPSDFMGQTPDAIAMEQLRAREADIEKERRLREDDRRANDTRFEKQAQLVAELNKALVESDKRRELAILEAKLEQATRAHMAPPAKPPTDWVAMAPALAAVGSVVVPVIVAMIDARKSREAGALTAAQAASTQQQAVQADLIKAVAGNKPEDPLVKIMSMVATIAPLATPLIKNFMDARSPDKVAELVSTMADNNLSQLSMMKQFLDPLLQQEDNPLVGFLQQGIQSLIDTAQHMVKATAPPAPRAPAPTQQPTGPTRQLQSNGNGNGHAAPSAGDAATATYFVNLILAAPNVPQELKTTEWQQILFGLHSFEPADEVAKAIAGHLSAQVDAGTLPAFLLPVFAEGSAVQPSAVLGQFLAGLPAASINQAYVQEVLEAFDDLFAPEDEAAVHA